MIKVATDAGGTFTDLVAFEETSGQIYVGKALTTPKDPSQGVIHSIAQSRETGLDDERDIVFRSRRNDRDQCHHRAEGRAHGTGHDRRLSRCHRDRPRQPSRPLQSSFRRRREPFVPRHLRLEVTERIDAKGKVRVPLSMASVDAVAEAIASTGVEAVAIVFLHAYINPAHEAAAAARLRALLPGVAVTASHEISRQWREYERSNTAVLSAYVQPVMARYLANLASALADHEIDCPYYCMQSNGGLAEFEAAERAPLVLVNRASRRRGWRRARWRSDRRDGNPLFDVGGTTAKCSLIATAGRYCGPTTSSNGVASIRAIHCKCRSSILWKSALAVDRLHAWTTTAASRSVRKARAPTRAGLL